MCICFAGDSDQFAALQQLVDSLISEHQLASHASIHNLSSTTDLTLPHPVFFIWPTPQKGYNATTLFQIQKEIRHQCKNSNPPIALIGHSTDSASFSRSLAKTVMTPREDWLSMGIKYLGLGLPDEQYLAPYFWEYPTIMFLDYEHNQRSCLRILKYTTLDLTLFKDSDTMVTASIEHLNHLRVICKDKNIATGLLETDLMIASYFDQNSDAAYKVFSTEILNLLTKYVPHSLGTCLFIEMVMCLMRPYTDLDMQDPSDIIRSVAKGLMMLRLWRKYLMINKYPLSAKPGAATDTSKRGWFLTKETYDSLEIQAHATIDYMLALYLHRSSNKVFMSPHNASTICTEKFIGQTQSKTTHLQSTNQEPTFAETLDRAAQIQFNINTLQHLAQQNVNMPSTTNRKKKISTFKKWEGNAPTYSFPQSYQEFQEQMKTSFREGVYAGQERMSNLPKSFQVQLTKEGVWNVPFTYGHKEEWLASKPPTYDKINCTLSLADKQHNAESVPAHPTETEWIHEVPIHQNHDQPSTDLSDGHTVDTNSGNACSDTSSDQVDTKDWYIDRAGKRIHLRTALKICIGGRDVIAKDRRMRHMANHLTNHVPVPKEDDILPLKFVAVKGPKHCCTIVQVLHIQDGGKRVRSTNLLSKAIFNGLAFAADDRNLKLTSKMVGWTSVKQIICNVDFHNVGEHCLLTDESTKELSEAGYLLHPCNFTASEPEVVSDLECSGDAFRVECIRERRLNKLQEWEYLVKFKDYPEKYNEWVSEENITGGIPFTSTSQSGRVRFHATRHSTESVSFRSSSSGVPSTGEGSRLLQRK